MIPKDIKLNIINHEGHNITFTLECSGFIGVFRIYYSDKSRKNASYESLEANEIYFEGFPKDEQRYLNSYTAEKCTDVMLFAERKKQWILEELRRSENKIKI